MAQVWYGKRGDLEFGPWSGQQLKAAAASGVLRPNDHVRTGEKDKWVRAGDVKGLAFGTIPVQPEPLGEPDASQPTSPERREPPPLPTKSNSGPPPLPASQPPPLPTRVDEEATRLQGITRHLSAKAIVILAVTGIIIVMAGIAGSLSGTRANEQDDEPARAGTAGVAGSNKGDGRPIEDVTFGEITTLLYKTPDDMVALLGRPDIKYRGESHADSWRYLGGWKRKNGNYVMICWIERIHPLTGRLELANVTINPGWENISRERLEAHRPLIR